MKHKHHIVPRHAGGTDDPSNLIEVTVEQHAELHFARYLTYGEPGDWVAYHSLSGQAGAGWQRWVKHLVGNSYSAKPRPRKMREEKYGINLKLCWDSVAEALSAGKHHWGNKKLSEKLGVSRRTLSKISAAIRNGETFEDWSGDLL